MRLNGKGGGRVGRGRCQREAILSRTGDVENRNREGRKRMFSRQGLFFLPLSNPFFYLGTLIILKDLSLIVLLSITGMLQVSRPEEEIANETPTYKVAI